MRKLMRLAVSAGVVGICTLTVDARASDDFYLGLLINGTSPQTIGLLDDEDISAVRLEQGIGFTGVFGTNILPGVRGELEFSYQRNEGKDHRTVANAARNDMSGNAETIFLMANMWKDFYIGGHFAPYAGIGIGAAITDISLNTDDPIEDTDLSFATQFGLGVRVKLGDRLTLDAGYRFRSTMNVMTKARITGATTDHGLGSYFTHVGVLGLNYHFGDKHPVQVSDDSAIDSSVYVTFFGSKSKPQIAPVNQHNDVHAVKQDDGFGVGVAVGTHLTKGLRGELEFSVLNHDPQSETADANDPDVAVSGHINQYLIMANVWKDIRISDQLSWISPYIGAGLGIGIADVLLNPLDGDGLDDTRGALAGQFGAGVRFNLTDRLIIDASYRYKGTISAFSLGQAGNDENGIGTYMTHNAQLGVTYQFGKNAHVTAAADRDPHNTAMNFYVALFGGLAREAEAGIDFENEHFDVKFDNGFSISAVVGTEVYEGVRGELEFSYIKVDPDVSTDTSTTAPNPLTGYADQYFVMANLWKDIHVGHGISPYLGAGLGIAVIDSRMRVDNFPGGAEVDDVQTAFAGQVGLGMRFAATDNLTFDFGYRYKVALNTLLRGTQVFQDHADATFENHIAQAGLAWGF